MALLPKKANTENNNEGLGDITPIPAGEYPVHIVRTEFKQTKKGDGHYLSVQMKVLDGEHKGRVLFSNLNLDNPNPVAVEIANKELNSICQAVGKIGVEDSTELHEIPMCAIVTVRDDNPNYPPSNEVKGYKPLDDMSSMHNTTAQEKPAKNTAASEQKLPWEK